MRVIITGATGFIGTALCRELHKDYEVIALSPLIEANAMLCALERKNA